MKAFNLTAIDVSAKGDMGDDTNVYQSLIAVMEKSIKRISVEEIYVQEG